jgi:hypothetical protein
MDGSPAEPLPDRFENERRRHPLCHLGNAAGSAFEDQGPHDLQSTPRLNNALVPSDATIMPSSDSWTSRDDDSEHRAGSDNQYRHAQDSSKYTSVCVSRIARFRGAQCTMRSCDFQSSTTKPARNACSATTAVGFGTVTKPVITARFAVLAPKSDQTCVRAGAGGRVSDEPPTCESRRRRGPPPCNTPSLAPGI